MPFDASARLLEPAEFYRSQLQANKVAAAPEDIAKFAEARGIPLHIAKLAKLYFEQLALDGVKYASEEARAEDAVKLAQAYFDQTEATTRAAVDLADKALEKLAAVAEEFLKVEGITGVSVAELLKVASLQQDARTEYELHEKTKTAALMLSRAQIKVSDAKLASAVINAVPHTEFYAGGVAPQNMRPDVFGQATKHFLGYAGENPQQLLAQHLNTTPDDPMLREHLHGILSQGYAAPGTNFETAAKSYLSTAPGQGNWMSRNSKWLIPSGIVGAGAAYLLYRHLKEKKERDQQQMLSMMGRRVPAMG